MARRTRKEKQREDGLHPVPESGQEADAPEQSNNDRKRNLEPEALERAYIQMIRKAIEAEPRLTLEQEIAYAKVMEAGQDAQKKMKDRQEKHALDDREAAELRRQISDGEAAKEKLIRSNLYVVASQAGEYRGGALSFGELFDAGYEKLIEKVEQYDYRKGNRVSTYVQRWVNGGMLEALRKANPAGFAQAAVRDANTLRKKIKAVQQEENREPSEEELSKLTGFSVKRVRHLLMVLQGIRSLEQMAESKEEPAAVEALHEQKPASAGLHLLLLERYYDQLTDPFFCDGDTLKAVQKLCRLEFGLEQEAKKKGKPALSANEQKKVDLWINQWHRGELIQFCSLPHKAFGTLLTPRTAAWFLKQYGDRIPRAEMRAAMEAFSQLDLCQLTDDQAPYRLISERCGGRQVRAIWDSCTKWLYQNYQNDIYEFILETRLSHPPVNQQDGS